MVHNDDDVDDLDDNGDNHRDVCACVCMHV